MMLRRNPFLVLLLLLAACGAPSGPRSGLTANDTSSGPVAAPASTAAAGLEETVNQALEAMANKDEVTLTEMFDASVGNLRSALAFQAIQRWNSMQTKTDIPVGGALGPIQSRQIQAAEVRGQTTVVPMLVTYEIGAARWEFRLRETDQGWKLLDILGKVTAQRQPSTTAR